MRTRTGKIALLAMLVAAAFVLAYLESLIPTFIAVPGVKLGLTNLVVLVALYKLGWKEALVINVIRIVLVGFTFGNMFSLMYSLAGGLLSGAGMIVLKNLCRARLVSVSVVGALLHNLGQLIVAMIVLDSSSLFYYLVVLWIAGAVAGTFLGLICVPIVKSIKKIP